MSIGKKVALGFLLMIFLMVGQGVFSVIMLNHSDNLMMDINTTRVPLAVTSSDLRESIQTSLSALRGWMLLGEDRFLEERADSWARIETSMEKLGQIPVPISDLYIRNRLVGISSRLRTLRSQEDEIEKTVHTVANLPATRMMQEAVDPLAKKIHDAMTRLMHWEGRRALGSQDVVEVKRSKALLKTMADFRGSFDLSLADVRAFLLTGDEHYPDLFKKQWGRNSGAFVTLQRADFTKRQRAVFAMLEENRRSMEIMIQRVMEIRGGNEWNLATWRLSREVVPLARQLEADIKELSDNQRLRMLKDNAELESLLHRSMQVTMLALVVSIIMGLVAAWWLKRQITRPLKKMASRMRRIGKVIQQRGLDDGGSQNSMDAVEAAEEEKTFHIDIKTPDAIGRAADAYNDLVDALRRANRVENAIGAFSRALSSKLDLARLPKLALDTLFENTNAVAGVIYIVREGELEMMASHGLRDVESISDSDHVRRAQRVGQIQRVLYPEDVKVEALLADFHPREVLVLPIDFKDTSLGILVLAAPEPFPEDIEWLLSVFRQNFGLALKNALAHDHLQQIAALDALTGVYNRHFGFSRLSEEFNRAVRTGSALGIIMLDVDHFKPVNDTYGHMVGDRVLVQVAKTARRALRDGDILVRFGGEEFLAILPGASNKDSQDVAERIRHMVAETQVKDGEQEITVTVSLGVTSYPRSDIEHKEDLVRLADDALYTAKTQGRNRVVMAAQSR
ncbi:MAG: diguanylate cyclase [Magnetococcales bacterium]|nr:diguanylate cyclase [Magnetococcales bacterium]